MNPLQNAPMNLPSVDPTAQSPGSDGIQPNQVVVATQPMMANAQPQPVSTQQPSVAISSPQTAQDSDLLEREWVNKVKEVVQTTNDDPYEQSRQLTMLKADYLQKRYNKAIRLT